MEYTFQAIHDSGKPFIFVSSQMANLSFSPYGALKVVGEHYTRALGGIIVKLWNVYGVETDMEKSHVITDFIHKAKNTRCIDMITDGTESRQFLHAEDCSRCLLTLAANMNPFTSKNSTSPAVPNLFSKLHNSSSLFTSTTIQPAAAKDEVQQDARIDPNPFIRAGNLKLA